MVLNGDHDLVHRDAHFLGGALNDSDIGLMRHDPVDIPMAQPGPASFIVIESATNYAMVIATVIARDNAARPGFPSA